MQQVVFTMDVNISNKNRWLSARAGILQYFTYCETYETY